MRVKCFNNKGLVMLGILIVIAIILILSFSQWSHFDRYSNNGGQVNVENDANLPWFEEERLTGGIAGRSPKREFGEEAESFFAKVYLDDEQRGQITLSFTGDGGVDGYWQAEYEHPGVKYGLRAEFAGRQDARKEYGGNSEEMLYFFTKGSYVLKSKTDGYGKNEPSKGPAYVRGWIGPDGNMKGEIIITSDKSWHKSYYFESEGQQ